MFLPSLFIIWICSNFGNDFIEISKQPDDDNA